MKLKKLLLFILIFFFCLVIKNNVNAYVVNEGGQGKYYLQDLPFDDSGETFTSVFFTDYNGVSVYCYQIPNYTNFGYDKLNKTFYCFDKADNSTATILCYSCGIEELDGLLVGGEWTSTDHFKYAKEPSYIGGTGKVYPCVTINSGTYLINNLIDGLSWNDDFALVKGTNEERIMLVVPSVRFKSGYFIRSAAYFQYYSIDSSSAISLNSYYLDTSDYTFKFYKSNTLSNFWPVQACTDYIFYCNKDILYNGEIYRESTKNSFKSLYEYKNFPYFLNGQEDLAKGEEDIIIMPRRF